VKCVPRFRRHPACKNRQGTLRRAHLGRDQDFNIVRFNGSYNGGGHSAVFRPSQLAHNVQPDSGRRLSFTAKKDLHYALSKKLDFKRRRAFGATTSGTRQEQELSKILVEGTAKDETATSNDLSPNPGAALLGPPSGRQRY